MAKENPKETTTKKENRNEFKLGFNTNAETWNGRLAMIGFVAVLIFELVSGQGLLHFFGLV